MKRKYLVTTIGLLFLSCQALLHGQPQTSTQSNQLSIQNMNKPTENAAELGRYGQIPVNLSTGQVGLNVPLYTVVYGGISIPINLNYNASGVRLDQHPTWVGLGFSLDAGGVITRAVKGLADDYSYPDPHNQDQMGGAAKGYLFGGNKLNIANWNTLYPNMTLFALSQGALQPADRQYYLADGVPDEYAFNFGGYSGSFFIDEKGVWHVHSQSNIALSITHEVNTAPIEFEPDLPNNSAMYLNKLIMKFTITTPDGVQYVFGGDVNSIDYSRPLKDDFYAFGSGPNNLFNISPTAWYLTKIIRPTGEEVILNYEKGLNVARINQSYQGVYYGTNFANIAPGSGYMSSSSSFTIATNASILTPCYLKEIVTPTQKIVFSRSYSTEQTYDPSAIWMDGNTAKPLSYFYSKFWTDEPSPDGVTFLRGWKDFRTPKYTSSSLNSRPLNTSIGSVLPDYSQKLTSIVINNISNNVEEQTKAIHFGYTNDPNVRLFLQSLFIQGPANSSGQSYSFGYYNMTELPNYLSWSKDQWGYFNNVNYTADPNRYSKILWRQPSLTYAVYGSLKSITYPTGGISQFEYELNSYSQYQQVTLNNMLGTSGTVSLAATGNTNAGGLRIKKVTSTAGFSAPPVIKEYLYNKDCINGGTVSSGILSRRNQYIEDMKFTNFCSGTSSGYSTILSDNEFEPFGEDVRLITYSEVAEKAGDGSVTVYKYSNYDSPGCLDEFNLPPFFSGVESNNRYKLTSNDLERGLLLKKEMYNASVAMVQEEIYDYDFNASRKQQYAKCIERLDAAKLKFVTYAQYGINGVCKEQQVFRLYPFFKYYYNIPLKQITQTTYNNSVGLTTTKQFVYDTYGNITQTTTKTSDNRLLVEDIRYNSNPAFLGAASSSYAIRLKNLFSLYNIKNLPIEQTTTLKMITNPVVGSDKIISGTLYEYDHVLPLMSQVRSMELAEPYYPTSNFGGGGGGTIFNYMPSAINASGNFVFDSKYKIQETVTSFATNPYDVLTRPSVVSNRSSQAVYTWDYKMQYMTSRTGNAVDGSVAFTSFEGSYSGIPILDLNRGYWVFDIGSITNGGFTGTKCLVLSSLGALTSVFRPVTGKNYILSFWSKGTFPILKNGSVVFGSGYSASTEWKYYEFAFTGTNQVISISGIAGSSAYLDEVRLYPANSRMESYTYNALGKITSIVDERGNATFYNYDGFGRLIEIRDANGNILQSSGYQLKGLK